MGTVRAGPLLEIWAFRLRTHEDGRLKWADKTRTTIESLVERLQSLDPSEEIEVDADEARDPIARFIRASTGEVLAELHQAPRSP
jgi:hypothetical protein